MTIYTLCIDPERGRYIAIGSSVPPKVAMSHRSESDAVGRLVQEAAYIEVDAVISIETSEP